MPSKRHHWWPMCHSSLWTDEEGCITVYDKFNGIRRLRPNNTAVIGHYNTVRQLDGSIDTSLEEYFATDVEGKAAPVLRRLATEKKRDLKAEWAIDKTQLHLARKLIAKDGFEVPSKAYSVGLNAADKIDLSRYIASLIVRVPSYKDALNSEAIQKMIASLLSSNHDESRIVTDLVHVDIIKTHLVDYATRLSQCEFIIVDTAKVEFIIGDTPVIPAALGFGDAEAMLPLTPDRAIFIIRGWRRPLPDRAMIFDAKPANVKAFNITMLQNSERQAFARSPISDGFFAKYLGTQQARIKPTFEPQSNSIIDPGPMLTPQSR